MKTMRLKRMIIFSTKEKAARIIKFHPKRTIITGGNDTGKSSVIKSIYQTFGAEILETSNWRKIDALNYIEFEVDKTDYIILNSIKPRWFFIKKLDNSGNVYFFNSITNELAPFLCELFDFKLELTYKNGDRQKALPAFLLMPFYIDQDSGWIKYFNSFKRTEAYKSWKADLIDYYVGKKSPEYFPIKTQKLILEKNLGMMKSQYAVQQENLANFIENFSTEELEIPDETFNDEITVFEEKIKSLNEQKREIKERLFIVSNRIRIINEQLNIVQRLSNELKLDYSFAAEITQSDNIECPTCGAEYENSLVNRFTLIDDHRKSVSIINELEKEKNELEQENTNLQFKISAVKQKIFEIKEILTKQRNRITFQEFIEIQARNKIKSKYIDTINSNEQNISQQTELIDEQNELMNELTDKKQAKIINDNYRKYLQTAFLKLDVSNVDENVYKRLDANIIVSGSDQPRAVLAYYYSILNLINENQNASLFPFIIDSPKQQEQDSINENKIYDFISDRFTFVDQLILGSVSVPNLDKFDDFLHYHFTEKLKVLRNEEFEEAESILKPHLEQALSVSKTT